MQKTQISNPNNLDELKEGLNKDRSELIGNLFEKEWFKKTDFELQKKLLTIPEDFDGFLKDLSERPEELGNLAVLKLVDLLVGNYLAIPVFEVRSLLTNEVFTYEYVSWKYGRVSGNKGIILVEVDNKIESFILRKGVKFPLATEIYDALGTLFYVTFSSDKLVHFPAKIENQLKKILGISKLQIKRFIDLGVLNTDPGMTNNHTGLFAIIVTADEAERIIKYTKEHKVTAPPTGYDIEIQPIDNLFEFVSKTNDSFFLACIARLMALNLIKL